MSGETEPTPAPAPVLVLYHRGCADGVTAAWMVRRAFDGSAACECVGVQYGDEVPDLAGRTNVFVVDFAWPLAVLEAARARVADPPRIVVLDHHESAIEAWPRALLAPAEAPKMKGCLVSEDVNAEVFAIFATKMSGAGVTWALLANDGDPLPDAIAYVQDWDLWRLQLPDSVPLRAWFHMQPASLDRVEEFDAVLLDPFKRDDAVNQGRAIVAATGRRVASVCRMLPRVGIEVPKVGAVTAVLVNSPSDLSEVGRAALDDDADAEERALRPLTASLIRGSRADVALVWRIVGDRFLVRVTGRRPVAHLVAEVFGGGGHPLAAGFNLPALAGLDLLRDLLAAAGTDRVVALGARS